MMLAPHADTDAVKEALMLCAAVSSQCLGYGSYSGQPLSAASGAVVPVHESWSTMTLKRAASLHSVM